ncbi:hypothetical protein CERZMDRAFT_41576 [Cercospora zeae-maydis SCOH1-5]|uniref:Glutathione synthetase n=1 Tax=Cercospora zeae-maydis SCOH1-5 TaxID=717836 RepID=A0A6A6FGG7_9PEZI|nr:hypothetical protein CERZMDRAFT_41576 [Cercospora zeae-maydis SCOH1-5]
MQLTEEEIAHRIREIQDYRLTHGMLLKDFHVNPHHPNAILPSTTKPLAVSILPTPFPKHLFQQAQTLQPLFNELYLRVAHDHEWLRDVFVPLIEHDPLVASLWKIYEQVRNAHSQQDVVCGIFRSDYMIDAHDSTIKQVEMNVFSASGFSHAHNVANMHQHVHRTCRGSADLPKNDNVSGIADMLKSISHTASTRSAQNSHVNTCILMIVQPVNFNIADERPIEHALWSRDIPCYRCEWQEIAARTQILSDDGSNTLLFHPTPSKQPLEVSVVYYRAGYEAREYVRNPSGMESRLRLELSRAIKCPDIATHLTTCKTVQQALTREGAVERFLSHPSSAPSANEINQLKNTFMEMISLQPPSAAADYARTRDILNDPAKVAQYILKANGDGGGHNVYGAAIPANLKSWKEEEWKKFVLMKRIESPKEIKGVLLFGSDREFRGEVVSELGVAGTCIWRRPTENEGEVDILWNRAAGWTLKTKPKDVEGMMVVKGVGAMDCPSLY